MTVFLHGTGIIPFGRYPDRTLEDLAPLYLVACDPRVQPSPLATSLLSSFLYQQAPRAALSGGPSASPFWVGGSNDQSGSPYTGTAMSAGTSSPRPW